MILRILKPTLPKCAGAGLIAAALHYGSPFVFMLAVTSEVLGDPEKWRTITEDFQKAAPAGYDLEQVGVAFAPTAVIFHDAFVVFVSYVVLALVTEWSVSRAARKHPEKRTPC